MAKVRPCKKGCGYPALKGKQFCLWHWLMRQSSDVQAIYAQKRLATFQGSWEYHVAGAHIARKPKSEWPDGERWCAGCQSFVPLFYTSGSRCKACASMAAHASRVEKTYGITAEEYDELYRRQGGRCAICRNASRSIRFAVDHNHQTGEVRGLLCKRCNHDLLGAGHDDVLLLFQAIEYLLFPPARDHGFTPTPDHVLAQLREHLLTVQRRNTPKLREEPQPAPF